MLHPTDHPEKSMLVVHMITGRIGALYVNALSSQDTYQGFIYDTAIYISIQYTDDSPLRVRSQ